MVLVRAYITVNNVLQPVDFSGPQLQVVSGLPSLYLDDSLDHEVLFINPDKVTFVLVERDAPPVQVLEPISNEQAPALTLVPSEQSPPVGD